VQTAVENGVPHPSGATTSVPGWFWQDIEGSVSANKPSTSPTSQRDVEGEEEGGGVGGGRGASADTRRREMNQTRGVVAMENSDGESGYVASWKRPAHMCPSKRDACLSPAPPISPHVRGGGAVYTPGGRERLRSPLVDERERRREEERERQQDRARERERERRKSVEDLDREERERERDRDRYSERQHGRDRERSGEGDGGGEMDKLKERDRAVQRLQLVESEMQHRERVRARDWERERESERDKNSGRGGGGGGRGEGESARDILARARASLLEVPLSPPTPAHTKNCVRSAVYTLN